MKTITNKKTKTNLIILSLVINFIIATSCTSKNKVFKKSILTGEKNIPGLNGPEVRRIWVSDKIEGNKLIRSCLKSLYSPNHEVNHGDIDHCFT